MLICVDEVNLEVHSQVNLSNQLRLACNIIVEGLRGNKGWEENIYFLTGSGKATIT